MKHTIFMTNIKYSWYAKILCIIILEKKQRFAYKKENEFFGYQTVLKPIKLSLYMRTKESAKFNVL